MTKRHYHCNDAKLTEPLDALLSIWGLLRILSMWKKWKSCCVFHPEAHMDSSPPFPNWCIDPSDLLHSAQIGCADHIPPMYIFHNWSISLFCT
mmetsp:Transcript_4192/g.6202  ORF Transcript_4192/g.6202 Transcript_4192/m.6202 type:complete len:93 (+) Transcript_4192:148-426(+)